MSTRAVPFGKYHLLERINVGGMAEVYKAKMIGVEGFEKFLAIKRILPAIAADKDFINMFIDEAKISVQLNHANIAQTFELGRLNDTYFIALEYVPGRDLRALFERLRKRGEVVPAELACYIMSRVAEGLDYAHRKKDVNGRELGIIHRDISPQNVLVSYEGEIKIIDFGIAKAANKIMKTQAGILKGKFGYMSPEQVRGLPLDRRSDIFAAGIVLYELLVGDRLFTGDSDYSILEKVRAANVPRASSVRRGVPAPLEKIVARALAKEPDDRYQHASELVADLQRYLLSQEKLFTREDLAAYIKSMFAEEFDREKRFIAEATGPGEETPTVPPTGTIDHSSSAPVLRGTSMRADSRPKLEGGPAARSATPPPPPTDSFLGDGEQRGRGLPPLRPSSRLAQATQAAETDKINFVRSARHQEEDTTTETDPDAQIAALQRRARAGTLSEDEELTPTPEDVGFRPALPVADLPTRIGRPATPPPIASQPPSSRQPSMSPPPRPQRLPAITDSLPQPTRRNPPPISAIDDEDEPTVLEDSPRRKAGAASMPARPVAPVKPPPPAPAVKRAPPPQADDDDEEKTNVGRGNAYAPRRKQNWGIVPIAGLIALAIAFAFLKWRGTELPGFSRAQPGAEPRPVNPVVPMMPTPAFAQLTVVTDPPDAQLYMDDKLVKGAGDRPWVAERFDAEVQHLFVARKDGFKDAAQRLTLARGAKKELTLKLRANGATLAVKTTPPGAQITIDGRDYARSPETIGALEPGRHVVRAELKCYETAEREVVIGEANEALDIVLAPSPGACLAPRPAQKPSEPGVLRLMSRPPARVFVDGEDTGRETPLIDYPLPAGTHQIRLVSERKSEDFEIEIEPGRPLTKIVVLR